MKTFRTTAILLTGILCCISCTEHKPAQQKAQPTIRQDTPGPEKTQIKDTVLSVKEDSVLPVKEESAEAETLYLADLDKARQQRKLNLSQLFRKAKVILLDSCSKALVGNINRTAMTGGYLFVLDKDVAKTVFMFDRNGKFIRTIGSPGKGKGEYISPSDFAIDTDRHHIYVLDRLQFRILQYDYTTGRYLTSISIHQQSNYLLYYAGAFYVDSPKSKDRHLIQKLSTDGTQTEHLFSPDTHNKGWDFALANQDGVFMSRYSGSPLITHLVMDTVFCIGKQKIYPHLALHSEQLMTREDIQDLDIDKNLMHLTELIRKDKYYNLQTYMENDHFIFFQLQKKAFPHPFLYDKTSGELSHYTLLCEDMLADGTDLKLLGLQFGGCNSRGAWFHIAPGLLSRIRAIKGMEWATEDNFNGAIFYYEY